MRQAQSVIEHAERFGLSQLRQLRGRVGRGAAASACVLLFSTGDAPRLGETARERLKAMAQTNDGFEIARRDLEIRGPGEFLGARHRARDAGQMPRAGRKTCQPLAGRQGGVFEGVGGWPKTIWQSNEVFPLAGVEGPIGMQKI